MSILSHSPRSSLQPSTELAGFTEGQAPPIDHQCEWDLVHVTLYSGEIILMCFCCFEYWHTDCREADEDGTRFVSHTRLIKSACKKYGGRNGH